MGAESTSVSQQFLGCQFLQLAENDQNSLYRFRFLWFLSYQMEYMTCIKIEKSVATDMPFIFRVNTMYVLISTC